MFDEITWKTKALQELSEKSVNAIMSKFWIEKGWQPRDPYGPLVTELVTKGILRRTDGRCGFERLKDAYVIPTLYGKALREVLLNETTEDLRNLLHGN